jgi:ketosteroid isomerase-like protein
MLDLVNSYYQCWAKKDREGARAMLADDLRFRSQWDKFDNADAYLDECWKLRADVESVQVFETAVEGDRGFFAAEWLVNDGTSFGDASFIQVEDGKIKRVVVISAGANVLQQFS